MDQRIDPVGEGSVADAREAEKGRAYVDRRKGDSVSARGGTRYLEMEGGGHKQAYGRSESVADDLYVADGFRCEAFGGLSERVEQGFEDVGPGLSRDWRRLDEGEEGEEGGGTV